MSTTRSICRLRTTASRSTAQSSQPRNRLYCPYAQRIRSYATVRERYSKPVLSENALLRDTVEDPSEAQEKGEEAAPRPPPRRRPMNRNSNIMAARLDPKPTRRRMWEQKKVIQSVQRRGRLSKTEVIRRTERTARFSSDLWKTSVKKLMPLAAQIAGKPLGEAILQMELSKKGSSLYIRDFLERARISAQVQRGMGLREGSSVKKDREAAERKAYGLPPLEEINTAPKRQEVLAPGEDIPEASLDEYQINQQREARGEEPAPEANNRPTRDLGRRITLNNGKTHMIYDNTTMYIAQAWVTKGPYGADLLKRARGRMDQLRLPQSRITVIIKEEATRLREHNERVEKQAKKKPWIQLPNRPVTAQRPYYCW